ncbi:hypothetical protein R3P38DRAFT_2800177 [Favolaschia claudopus]|uniref:Uncharacterized protein n=1 Tax=Favolaschia claudopus TaxID=2862362 RepID=A0AAV9ZY22_9AGAR
MVALELSLHLLGPLRMYCFPRFSFQRWLPSKGRSKRPAKTMKGTSPSLRDVASPRSSSSSTAHTGWNVLTVSLRTLSQVSGCVPLTAPLSAIIDPLLDLTSRVQQTSKNKESFVQLATRLDQLRLIVEDLATTDPGRCAANVQSLSRALGSFAKDMATASKEGTFAQFFNSDDNAATIQKHNEVFAGLISDLTLGISSELLRSVKEMEVEPAAKVEQVKSEGKEGLEWVPYLKCPQVAGGMGGQGGSGLDIGGEGGVGSGPVIGRRSHFRS